MADFVARTKVRRLPDDTTLHVHLSTARSLRYRIRLGVWLLRVAAWVMGVSVEIQLSEAK